MGTDECCSSKACYNTIGEERARTKQKFIELTGESKEPVDGSLVGWDCKGKGKALGLWEKENIVYKNINKKQLYFCNKNVK